MIERAKRKECEDMSGYPVSEEKCGKCPMCSLVTKDIAGNYLDSSECYH